MSNEQERLEVATKPNVLISIVDDDESVREALEELIVSVGFRVRAFRSAMDFLAFADIRGTSCMIADVNMPRMSGVELYCRLAELGHVIPTILITAYPDDRTRARALAEGIAWYLTKPFDDEDLIGCVRSALKASEPPADG
jgi:FixJ family two-component response regulator